MNANDVKLCVSNKIHIKSVDVFIGFYFGTYFKRESQSGGETATNANASVR